MNKRLALDMKIVRAKIRTAKAMEKHMEAWRSDEVEEVVNGNDNEQAELSPATASRE